MAARAGRKPHLALLRRQRLRHQEDDEHKVEQAHRGSDVHGRTQPVLGVEERRDREAQNERACGPGTHCTCTRRAARSLMGRGPGGPGAWWAGGPGGPRADVCGSRRLSRHRHPLEDAEVDGAALRRRGVRHVGIAHAAHAWMREHAASTRDARCACLYILEHIYTHTRDARCACLASPPGSSPTCLVRAQGGAPPPPGLPARQ